MSSKLAPAVTTPSTSTSTLASLGFNSIDPSTHLLSRPNATTTILFCAWMNAPQKPLLSYLTSHITTHPDHNLLLLQSSPSLLLSRPTAAAVSALRTTPRVIAHIFSNGGGSAFLHLSTAYLSTVGTPIPLHGMVLDSMPGSVTLSYTVRPLVYEFRRLPWFLRLPATATVWVTVLAAFTVEPLLQMCGMGFDFVTKTRKAMNDDALVVKGGRNRRAYIYSKEDKMVDWRAVEEHAAEAREKGWEVGLERMDGTGHVAHVRGDRERYWRIVEGAWSGLE